MHRYRGAGDTDTDRLETQIQTSWRHRHTHRRNTPAEPLNPQMNSRLQSHGAIYSLWKRNREHIYRTV